EGYQSQQDALHTISQYGSALNIDIIILVEGKRVLSSDASATIEPLFSNETLSQVFAGKKVVQTEGDFPHLKESEDNHSEIMIVGVPLNPTRIKNSAVFVYQSLSAIEETSNETRKIIYFSAGI